MTKKYFGFLVVATAKRKGVYLEAKEGDKTYSLLKDNEEFIENVTYIDLLARYISKEITWEKYMRTIYKRTQNLSEKRRIYVTVSTVQFLELQKKMV